MEKFVLKQQAQSGEMEFTLKAEFTNQPRPLTGGLGTGKLETLKLI